MKYLIGVLTLSLAGCSTLLPHGDHAIEGPWTSFEEAQRTFDAITPYQTRIEDLTALGLDPVRTPNITLLNYSDVVNRFVPSTVVDSGELDAGVSDCIRAKMACKGFEIDQRHIKRNRTGNFWADFMSFKRRTDVVGWHFKGMLLFKDDLVVYKLIGGQPLIRETEQNMNPLGPLQGIGESSLRYAR